MNPADPYAEAERVYGDRYESLAVNARNWRLAGTAAASLLALSLIGNIVQSWQVKRLPYVVLADSRGYAITIPQPLTPASTTIDLGTIERYEVAAFIRAARTVLADADGERALLGYVSNHARGQADGIIGAYLKENSPFRIAHEHSISVIIDSLISQGPHSYQVRWTETCRDKDGHTITDLAPGHYVALLKTQVGPGGSPLNNPAGIYVTELNWGPEGATS
jgi:type IV secretion system protein VirB5